MFKVGDKVKYLPLSPEVAPSLMHNQFKDQVLTVREVRHQMGSKYLVLDEAVPMWPDHAQLASRFVLAGPNPLAQWPADPSGLDAHTPGAKLDAGKPQPLLVERDMSRALAAVIEVATFGATKYSPGGWLKVKKGFDRYSDAEARHRNKRHQGETRDADSGLLHLQHEAWNALAKLELYLRKHADKV